MQRAHAEVAIASTRFGYLAFARAAYPRDGPNAGITSATAAGAKFASVISATAVANDPCVGLAKVWALVHPTTSGGKELRVVLLNKARSATCTITLRTNGYWAAGEMQVCTLRTPGSGLLLHAPLRLPLCTGVSMVG